MTGRINFLTENPALKGFMDITNTMQRQDIGDQNLALGGIALKRAQREETQTTDADSELAKTVLDQIAQDPPDVSATPRRQEARALATKGQGRKAADLLQADEKEKNDRYVSVIEQYGTKGNSAVGDVLASRYGIKIPPALKQNKVFADGIVAATKLDPDHGDPEWTTKFAIEYAKNGGDPEAAMGVVGTPKPKRMAGDRAQLYTHTAPDGTTQPMAFDPDTKTLSPVGLPGSVSKTGPRAPGTEKKFVTQNDAGEWVYGWRKPDGSQEISSDKAPPPAGVNRGSVPLKTQNEAGDWVWGKFDRTKGEIVPTDSLAPPPSNSADAAKAKAMGRIAAAAKAATDKEFQARGKSPTKVPEAEWMTAFDLNLKRAQAGEATPAKPAPRGGQPQAGPAPAAAKPAPAPVAPKPHPKMQGMGTKDAPYVVDPAKVTQADLNALPPGTAILMPNETTPRVKQ